MIALSSRASIWLCIIGNPNHNDSSEIGLPIFLYETTSRGNSDGVKFKNVTQVLGFPGQSHVSGC